MARPHGVQITKRVTWRGFPEEFSNVYHFNSDASVVPTEQGWHDLANEVATRERPVFGTNVSFVGYRVFGPTDGTKLENQMVAVGDLTGTGSSGGIDIPFELCGVASIYVGRNPATGRKRFLRKYWHHCRDATGAIGSNDYQLGNTALPAAWTDKLVATMDSFREIVLGLGTNHLCTPDGVRAPAGNPAVALPHLHIRQFKQ